MRPTLILNAAVVAVTVSTAQAQSTDVLLDCSTCHVAPSADRSGGDIYPVLNGQPARYIERQLMAYREGLRQHRQMHLTAVALGDGAGAMARLYSGAPHPELVFREAEDDHATALKLVEEGDWSRGLPPCASCHALDAEDSRARLSPRLHGQPEAYLGDQLRAYADGTRESDPMGRMRAYSGLLTETEISDLARYYASWSDQTESADGGSQ